MLLAQLVVHDARVSAATVGLGCDCCRADGRLTVAANSYCTINATDSELTNATDLRLLAEAAFPCQTNASSAACHTPGANPATPPGQHSKVVMSAVSAAAPFPPFPQAGMIAIVLHRWLTSPAGMR